MTPVTPVPPRPGDARRIGILGGTFDPVHVGHLFAAVEVRFALSLDVVLLMVANRPWQKVGQRQVSPAEDRFAVVEAAVKGLDGVEPSRLEIDRGGTSYTADTVGELARRHPGAELFVVVGTDVADDLHTWVRSDEVRAGATIVVVTRPGAPVPDLSGWRSVVVPMPLLEISSTDLRRRAREGRPIDVLVPPAAVHCIRERGLYAGPR